MKDNLVKKNRIRRFGTKCESCGGKLGRFRLDGKIGGESISFCGFSCMDKYQDALETKPENTEES